jgi:indole-3-glycerol phosphate synthase
MYIYKKVKAAASTPILRKDFIIVSWWINCSKCSEGNNATESFRCGYI